MVPWRAGGVFWCISILAAALFHPRNNVMPTRRSVIVPVGHDRSALDTASDHATSAIDAYRGSIIEALVKALAVEDVARRLCRRVSWPSSRPGYSVAPASPPSACRRQVAGAGVRPAGGSRGGGVQLLHARGARPCGARAGPRAPGDPRPRGPVAWPGGGLRPRRGWRCQFGPLQGRVGPVCQTGCWCCEAAKR